MQPRGLRVITLRIFLALYCCDMDKSKTIKPKTACLIISCIWQRMIYGHLHFICESAFIHINKEDRNLLGWSRAP